jgi:hypothetical protein
MKKTLQFLTRSGWLLMLSLFIWQCQKEDEKTRAELIIGNWVAVSDTYSPAYDYDGDGTLETEAYPLWDACDKDDVFSYKSNGVGELNMGVNKCTVDEPQSIPFEYVLKDNSTILFIMDFDDFNIEQLDESTLRLRMMFEEEGVVYTSRITFTRK